MDKNGAPIGNKEITFSIEGSGGTVLPSTGRTAADGWITFQWTLGTVAGTQKVVATSDLDVNGEPQFRLEFSAFAQPGPMVALKVVSGAGQDVPAFRVPPIPIIVNEVDAFGNQPMPAAGSTVNADVEYAPVDPNDSWAAVPANLVGMSPYGLVGYYHSPGEHQVRATHQTMTLDFTINVVPTTHPLDGFYNCIGTGELSDFPFNPISFTDPFILMDGKYFGDGAVPPYEKMYSVEFVEATGAITALYSASIDTNYQLTGQFARNPDGTGTGLLPGTFGVSESGPPPFTDGFGTWSCTRQ